MQLIKCGVLETDRLILRPFLENDVVSMFNNWATDELAVINMSWDVHKSVEVTEKLIKNWIVSYNNDYYYNWAIYSKKDDDIIGNISVVNFSTHSENCEIGYIIGSKWWNNGFVTEALKEVINFLINEVQVHMVYALHDILNPASGKVMEKAGMKYECTLREKYKRKDGTFADLKYYSIKKEEL